jgi:hypothetical protein
VLVGVVAAVVVDVGDELDGSGEGELGLLVDELVEGVVFGDGSVPVDDDGVAAGCPGPVVVPAGVDGVVAPVVIVVVGVVVVVGAVELVGDEALVGSVPVVVVAAVPVEVGAVPAELVAGSGVVVDCGDVSTASDILLNVFVVEAGAAVETPVVSAAAPDVSVDVGPAAAAAAEAAAGSDDEGV